MVIVIGFALNVNGYDAIRTSNEVCYPIKGGVIARAFMEANVEEELTVEQIARVAMLNRFYFLTTFKASFGVIPHEYLSAGRMERAYQLLVRGY